MLRVTYCAQAFSYSMVTAQTHISCMANLGALLHKEGLNWTEAESWYVRTLRTAPNETSTLLNYVELLNLRGDHDKALELVEYLFNLRNLSLSQAPGSVSFLSHHPFALDARDCLAVASAQLSSTGSAPLALDVHRALADTLRRGNASRDAESVYSHILSEFPSDISSVGGLAGLLAARGETELGRQCYMAALDKASAHVTSCEGHQPEADMWTEREASLRADFGEYLWQWVGDVDAAKKQFSQALACRSCKRAREAFVALMVDMAPPVEAATEGPMQQSVQGWEEPETPELVKVNNIYQDALQQLAQKNTSTAALTLEEARIRAEWVSYV
jgi:tetratricopeptide (TPR) repeat protein